MDNLKVTYFDTVKLIPDPENVRQHDRRNIDAIKQSIQRFGIRKPIVAHELSKIVYAGNGVLLAAIELNIEQVPVAWIPADVPAEVAKAYSVYDNRTTELSSFDPVKLDNLLAELPDINLDELLWTSTELDELLQSIENKNANKEETFDVGAVMETEGEPITKTGDVWICGKHKVMAGDSTKAEDVEKLMRGEKADAIVTDPPYGVTNESWDRYPTQTDFDLWASITDGAIIVFGAAPPRCLKALLSIEPMAERIYIWWNTFTLTHSEGAFWQWQPIYVWRRAKVEGLRKDVIDMAANTGGDKLYHVTQKPVALISELLIACTNAKLFYDPFLGSGTTLISCIKTNRVLFGMEISSHYCDVICKRYFDFTGDIPILEATGEPFPIESK